MVTASEGLVQLWKLEGSDGASQLLGGVEADAAAFSRDGRHLAVLQMREPIVTLDSRTLNPVPDKHPTL